MKEKSNIVEVIHELSEELLEQVISMEEILFPEPLRSAPEDIRRTFQTPDTVKVVAYCDKGRVAGYVSSVHHHEAYEYLKTHDPEIDNIPGALYLDSIAVRPDLQGKGYFSKLMEKFLEHAGPRPVTMHARIVNNCSLGMQKHGARFIRSVDDWYGSGEPFDYLIIPPEEE